VVSLQAGIPAASATTATNTATNLDSLVIKEA
jgi:hypothetical protein